MSVIAGMKKNALQQLLNLRKTEKKVVFIFSVIKVWEK